MPSHLCLVEDTEHLLVMEDDLGGVGGVVRDVCDLGAPRQPGPHEPLAVGLCPLAVLLLTNVKLHNLESRREV